MIAFSFCFWISFSLCDAESEVCTVFIVAGIAGGVSWYGYGVQISFVTFNNAALRTQIATLEELRCG